MTTMHMNNQLKRTVIMTLSAWVGVITCMLFALSVTGVKADTPMARGDITQSGDYNADVTLPLSVDWQYTSKMSPYNPCSPAVSGDTVYFISASRVYALNKKTGALEWKYPADAPLTAGIHTTPAIGDTMIYFGADNGKLYALRKDTGAEVWIFDTHSSIGCSPILYQGVLYFGNETGNFYAVDAKTGDQVKSWLGFKANDEIQGSPCITDDMIFAISLDQVVHAANLATGRETWRYRLSDSVQGINLLAQGDFIYVPSGSRLHCLFARSGASKWTQLLPDDIAASPAISAQGIYVVSDNHTVYAFNPTTGQVLWKKWPKVKYDVIAPPTICGNLLFVGTIQGLLYAIDTQTGAIKWIYDIAPSTPNPDYIPDYANVGAAPVADGSSLYVLTDDGTLTKFSNSALDTTPPVISDVVPEIGWIINGTPPVHFQAKIEDVGSGVNPDSIHFTIDGDTIPRKPERDQYTDQPSDKPGYTYDPSTCLLEYETVAPTDASAVHPMTNGRHVITLSVADWRGNVATKTWSFTVDNSIAKTVKPNVVTQPNNRRYPYGGNNPYGGGYRGGRGGYRGGGYGGYGGGYRRGGYGGYGGYGGGYR